MATNPTDRFTNYIMKIECCYCGTEVYPDEDEARAAVEYWVKYEGVGTVEHLRAVAGRTCDGCRHMSNSN